MTAVASHAAATAASTTTSNARRIERRGRASLTRWLPREHVAHAAYRADQLGRQLAAQMMDVHVDRVAFHLVAPCVQALLDLPAGEHAAGVERELVQQVEFLRLQVD